MTAAYQYGNLFTSQGSRNYRMPSQAASLAGAVLDTQNWAGLAAASSARAAQENAGWMGMFGRATEQGIAGQAQLASSVVNAYGGIGQQGVSAAADERVAELAIQREKVARGGTRWGALAGAGVGLASLFVG